MSEPWLRRFVSVFTFTCDSGLVTLSYRSVCSPKYGEADSQMRARFRTAVRRFSAASPSPPHPPPDPP